MNQAVENIMQKFQTRQLFSDGGSKILKILIWYFANNAPIFAAFG